MKKDEVQKIVNLRQGLLERYSSLRDYRNNKNAIMKEIEHARILHEIIVSLDNILKGHVDFK